MAAVSAIGRSCPPTGSRHRARRARARGGTRIASTATAGGRRISADTGACFAWGFGGQYVFVFRDLELVVVVTSSTTVSDERRGYRRALFDLLAQHVLPIVRLAEANESQRADP